MSRYSYVNVSNQKTPGRKFLLDRVGEPENLLQICNQSNNVDASLSYRAEPEAPDLLGHVQPEEFQDHGTIEQPSKPGERRAPAKLKQATTASPSAKRRKTGKISTSGKDSKRPYGV